MTYGPGDDIGEPKMTMAQFWEEEERARGANIECGLCGTWVHKETEYLGSMMGCVYCQEIGENEQD